MTEINFQTLLDCSDKGQSVSLFGMEASGHNTKIENILNKGNLCFATLDCRLLTPKNNELTSIICFNNKKITLNSLFNWINSGKQSKEKIWLHAKNIEEAISKYPNTFKTLRGLSRLNKNKLTLIFSGNHWALRKEYLDIPHVNIIYENIFISPPLNKSSGLKAFDSNIIKRPFKISKEDKDYFFIISGGNPNILKGIAKWLNSQKTKPKSWNLSELITKNEIEVRLLQIFKSFNKNELNIIQKLLQQKNIENDNEHKNLLSKIGFINENNCLFSLLFEEYFRNKTKNQETMSTTASSIRLEDKNIDQMFTEKESLLLKTLIDNKNFIMTRDRLFSTIWKEDIENYSDWNLDQLVKRLRSKLNKIGQKEKLLTVKGRGFMWYDQNTNF